MLRAPTTALQSFVERLRTDAPAAAVIAEIEVHEAAPDGFTDFTIRESERRDRPTVRISPDLPVCDACLKELFDPADRRFHYPYINCTDCGPRYTVILALPYDRPNTTMKDWPLDEYCAGQYHDPANRRFHAQPVACPQMRTALRAASREANCARRLCGGGRWRQASARRQNRRGEGAGRISPGLRRAKRSGGECACASANIARKSRSP